MKLYHYRTTARNFGDDLNQWLWPKLIPELLDPTDGYLFVGIGTILNQRIPELPQKVVFGAGVGYGPVPILDDSWTVYCVRGPLTAAALRLPLDMAITDPALLVSTLTDLPTAAPHCRIGFMPHFETSIRAELDGLNLPALSAEAEVTFIDPGGEVNEVLAAIRGCEVVISEAMHGAIVADALRVPWIPVRCYDHILDFKWRDWCESLQLQYEPAILDTKELTSSGWTSFLKSTSYNARPVLSSEAIVGAASERLQDRLERLRQVYASSHAFTGGQPDSLPRDAGVANPSAANEDWADVRTLWASTREAGKQIDSIVGPEDPVIFVDGGEWASQLSSGRKLIPFLERDGQYWGPPPDSGTAILELERLRAMGARFIIFAEPAFWWLDYYAELGAHLRSTYRQVLKDDRLIAFSLK
jgi:succinoglycan biosynthesis protein ExoV